MLILAIESSCDETSIAILRNGKILSNVISSQYFHSKYGGVIPELASRAHVQTISSIYHQALNEAGTQIEDIEAIAVTNQPGLMGSLIVGTNFAKGLALKHNLPIVPVNHIEGHLYSGYLQEPDLSFPAICLVVSGGHTVLFYVHSYNKYDIIGLTRDDAAGEAFDKISKMLGLGYPGGPIIDRLAKEGNPAAYNFPRSMINSGDLDFSFSGLKTSFRTFLHKNFPGEITEGNKKDLAASVQAAIVDVLTFKTISAAKEYKVKNIIVAGGVSANSQLKKDMTEKAAKRGMHAVFPSIQLSMDNAAMIGFLAEQKLSESGADPFHDFTFTAAANALRAKRK
ncbi:MAG: tRNA (adenosine(37)-N6)-threonylcarbamoyltransferase complex transferase subunit TsaD [Ignavibacteria bacterium GWF2_33_9]|nr:MAG: tRNA (adenosine(37)-N6)-threonylcarbamoyltransferase complex transferase subunit TsaD [Ignavibacteria bacterium GWF2_33_9]